MQFLIAFKIKNSHLWVEVVWGQVEEELLQVDDLSVQETAGHLTHQPGALAEVLHTPQADLPHDRLQLDQGETLQPLHALPGRHPDLPHYWRVSLFYRES